MPMPITERLPLRLTQLLAGLVAYGVSITLMLKASLGNQPWDVLHQGIALHTGLSVGTVLILAGATVLLCWIPLRQRPGIGTVANIVVLGLVVDLVNTVLPHPSHLAMRWLFMTAGILLCGIASGLYIGANLGPGPRDGLMTGLAARSWSLRGWRTVLEITVVAIGALLGGKVGIGTVAYALAIGPLAQFFLPMLTIRPHQTVKPRLEEPALKVEPQAAPLPASCGS
ncbi:membrane protein [Rhizocola hellebori]|uniref:Membrane protein n=1 Tax=Rhizocola hellebori TaxID=1392758 RepID=A0A8J3Q6Y3_9ACTN|nr:hypothetical protein [Rhizocola hellebori]GIH04981.1 membrane protein [Rhizocola hellebori]